MAIRTSAIRGRQRRSGSGLFGFLILAAIIFTGSIILNRQQQDVQAKELPAPIVAQFDTVALPVPLEPVAVGVKAGNIKLRMVTFPRHQVPSGALLNLGSVLESITIAPLPAGLPLFAENFAPSVDSHNPVTERIPPGMRAMTIRVDATSAVEGWAGSGTIIDVLLVGKDRTTVVAEKVKVLSAERSVSPVEGASAPNIPSTVTLLVTQEQCLAINTAIPLGKIAFALRSNQDSGSWGRIIFTAENLKGATGGTNKESAVNGYVAVRDGADNYSFALADGKWMRADSVPEGFFINRRK